MTKHLALAIILFFINWSGYAQYKISGKTFDLEGSPIPFVSITIKNTTKAVSSNGDGDYAIISETPNITLVFSAIGYKSAEKQFILKEDVKWDQTLQPETYVLNAVEIIASKEDPAIGIMREAIARRKTHLNEVKGFQSDVYIKGLQKLVGAPKNFFGADVQEILSLDTNRKGIIYLSESQSQFSYQRPDQFKEVMVSSKVSGRNNAFSYNKASDMMINFYENLILENSGLNSRSFVSPLSDNAFLYYNFKLLGRSEKDGLIVNKIAVNPKRSADPAFQGVVYIFDQNFRLAGVDLKIVKSTGINLLDTLTIQQEFQSVDEIHLPGNQKFMFSGNVLGFKFEGYFVTIFSNLQLVNKFPKGYFSKEILLITKAVNKKDSLYWANNRPIQLSAEEIFDYKRKDSIALIRSSKPYLDSVQKAQNKFSAGKLVLTGYSIQNRLLKSSITIDPLKDAAIYNTVEGFALKLGLTYQKTFNNETRLQLSPQIRYGFSNKTLTGMVSANYLYDKVNRGQFNFTLGSDILDLNNYGSIPLLSNSLNSLIYEKNLSKFYKKSIVQAGYNRDLFPGLNFNIQLQWSKNEALLNTSFYTFRDLKDKHFSPNNPFSDSEESLLFNPYKAFTIQTNIRFTPGVTYTTTPNGRTYNSSKYPTFNLQYKKGINGVGNSDVDFDFIGFEIYRNQFSIGMLGKTSAAIGFGKFLNQNSIYYPEFKHYRGNSAFLYKPELRKFRFLDFYYYSTPDEYLEAHVQHNFGGFLLNKLPYLRKLKLDEIIGVNYLSQPGKKNYTEFYFGVERFGFGISYGYAFDGKAKSMEGLRLTYIF